MTQDVDPVTGVPNSMLTGNGGGVGNGGSSSWSFGDLFNGFMDDDGNFSMQNFGDFMKGLSSFASAWVGLGQLDLGKQMASDNRGLANANLFNLGTTTQNDRQNMYNRQAAAMGTDPQQAAALVKNINGSTTG